MATFLAALVVFATALLGMAVGVMTTNRCLKGSCGGMNNLPEGNGKSICDACSSTTASHSNHSETAK